MKQCHAARISSGICATILLLLSLFLVVPTAHSETYIAGQFGMALPSLGGGLTGVENNFTSPSFEMPDWPLTSSFLYGAKVGYYFSQAKWFGLETEVYNTTPHMKQHPTTVTVPAGTFIPGVGTTVAAVTGPVTFDGNHLRVLMWSPVNLMFRYPNMRLQPYIGFGPGIFFSRVSVTTQGFEASQSNIRVGLNAKAGAEYFITKQVAVFGEWKFNYVRFNFDEALGLEGTYNMHLVAGGLSYHF
jgi:opacity protein-like surface antigen